MPAFYLSQWAVPTERTGKLMVFDRTNGKSWPSKPDEVAFVRDFYTLDAREAPQAAEDALSTLEAIGADAIQTVTSSGALPATTEIRRLLSFVALQAARTLRVRENLERFYSDTHLLVLNTLVDAPDAFAKHARSVEPDIADEDIRKLREKTEVFSPPFTTLPVLDTTRGATMVMMGGA